MPIYAYRCEHCDFQKDVLQKMSDPLLVTCPSCGEPTFKKQVTAAGFQLKGSGWYVTDFRDSAKKDGAKKDGTKPGDATQTSDATTNDAKPDAGDSKPAAAENASAGTPAPTPAPAPAKPGGDAKSGSA